MSINVMKMTNKIQKLLVLKVVEQAPAITAAEIYEHLKLNGITGISYVMTYHITSELDFAGYLDFDEAIYTLNDKGAELLDQLESEIAGLLTIISDFKIMSEKKDKDNAEGMPNMFMCCPEIKIIPYSAKNLDTPERVFFNTTLPGEKNNTYTFDNRGLGKGVVKGSLVAFQNNNLVKYVGIIESYDSKNGVKQMHLRPGSVHELAVPITMRDMSAVREGFRFAQNKQTICDMDEVNIFIDMVGQNW